MLRQDFTTQSLLRATTRNEIIKFKLGRDEDDYKIPLGVYSENINDYSFKIKDIQTIVVNSKKLYFTDSPEEHYCIKKSL